MTRPITIKDIAAHVGVSSTTVSAVLGRNPSGHVRVSEAMRTRILDAAQQMNYRPNGVARSLRYQKTNVIGVYTAYGYLNPYVAFTSLILGGLHLGCDENGKARFRLRLFCPSPSFLATRCRERHCPRFDVSF